MTLIPLSSDWQTDWRQERRGKFTAWPDRRGLYNVRHPWERSDAGDGCELIRDVRLPETWRGPLFLTFFATDNHHGRGYDPAQWPHYVGADIFVGHRYAQVLVDDEVVWEQDVAETDSPGWKHGLAAAAYEGFYHAVDLAGRVRPGQSFRLRLRITDKVASGEPLPGDVHQAHFWESVEIKRPEVNAYFDFTGWWGDVFLAPAPDAAGARTSFARRIELASGPAPAVAPAAASRVRLEIARADALPSVPYPLWGGVPFPRGLVRDERQIRLLDESGNEVDCQVSVRARWPQDGSVEWAWLTLVVPPGRRALLMECGPAVSRREPATPLRVIQAEGSVQVDTGAAVFSLKANAPALIESYAAAGGAAGGPVTGVLNQQLLGSLRRHGAWVERLTVEEAGPVRAAVLAEGALREGEAGRSFGRFTCRFWAWAGLPLASLSFRIFQETDQLVAMVDDLLLEVAAPADNAPRASFSPALSLRPLPEGQVRELELRQARAAEYQVTGRRAEKLETGAQAPGWVDLRWAGPRPGGIAAGVRWFWQQHPKTLTAMPGGLTLGLVARRARDDWDLDSPLYFMTRGEAKRHQVWLWPHAGAVAPEIFGQVQRAWDARPHLLNGAWFAGAGVLGAFVADRAGVFPELDKALAGNPGGELKTARTGLRDFRETAWCQNYRGRAANGLLEYFSTGRPEWQDYFEQVMHHHLDVDTIHFEPAHPEWVGAIRSYSPYHTTGEASHGINSNCQDQFLHYFFTGEPDSLGQALLAAEHIRRLGGDQGRSARQEGWPLAQMAVAYLATGDPRYRQAAGEFFAYANHYTHPRRGAYDELHSSFANRGIVPFMTGYLGYGLIRYHQATGDERAARLLVALAEATVSETGDGQGGFWYSPCPTQRNWGSASWSGLVGGMLAYAYRLTGDPWFARQAELCAQKIVGAGGVGLDMAPLLGELLAGIAAGTASADAPRKQFVPSPSGEGRVRGTDL